MVLVDSKTSGLTSLVNIAPQKESENSKGKLSFSELLRGVTNKTEEKVTQNGALILSLADTKEEVITPKMTLTSQKTDKSESLLSLLKTQESSEVVLEKSSLELNPKVSDRLSSTELKTLIYDAKTYLKNKITSMEGFKQSEIATLPKTLKGLAQVAQKFGIDVSKITLEEVQTNSKSLSQTMENRVEIKTLQERGTKAELAKESVTATKENLSLVKENLSSVKETPSLVKESSASLKDNSLFQTKREGANDQKREPSTQQELSKESVTRTKETPSSVKDNSLSQTERELTANLKKELAKESVTVTKENLSSVKESSASLKDNSLSQTKREGAIDQKMEPSLQQELSKESVIKTKESLSLAKETPLFKAHVKTELSTQEIVNTRANAIESKIVKEKKNESLQLLLRGENVSKEESRANIDVSAATAKVLHTETTSQTTPRVQSLESLLKGETKSQESNSSQGKLDGLHVAKTESLELKLNEAKQMVKYLSQDVKTAIDDYKSPFTRIKVQLNPQKLGEVDLTVVQRGKNLHISLSSNNSAINTLAMNANELKMQLTNNGINNASLNFSNNSQSQDGSASQQQNSHQRRDEAAREYNYFESEEANEEIINSLEIIVPSYA